MPSSECGSQRSAVEAGATLHQGGAAIAFETVDGYHLVLDVERSQFDRDRPVGQPAVGSQRPSRSSPAEIGS